MTTFTFDAYKGWPEAKLKARCRQLVRIAMRKDIIIAVLATEGIDGLTAEDRKEVERICSQWDD